MKPVELKRCPRCGGKAVREERNYYKHVGCTKCGLRTRDWHRIGDAVKDWNKLAAELVRGSLNADPKALREMIAAIRGWTLAKRSILEQLADFHENINKLTEAAGKVEADGPRLQDRLAELFDLADGLSESGGKKGE